MIQIFRDDDEGYLEWVTSHPGGFVVNCDREPYPRYLKLHRATCRTITGTPVNGRRWTAVYVKVCSTSFGELQILTRHQPRGQPTNCRLCNP